MKSSFRHITRTPSDAERRTPRRDRRLPEHAIFLFTFRISGKLSDPETSPLVPARYAGDTTLRFMEQLQGAPPAPVPAKRPLDHHESVVIAQDAPVQRWKILGGVISEYYRAAQSAPRTRRSGGL
jgi:hypothetical protein